MKYTSFVSAALTSADFTITLNVPITAKVMRIKGIDFYGGALLSSTYVITRGSMPITSDYLMAVSNAIGLTYVDVFHSVTGPIQGTYNLSIIDVRTGLRPSITSGQILFIIQYED